jgi:hypothetical protein
VDSAAVTFDETWVPHVQAELTCAMVDQATRQALDPRDPHVRIRLDAGYYLNGTLDQHTIADLGLRTRVPERPGNTMRLTAASDESMVLDAGPVLQAPATLTNVDLEATVKAYLPVPLGFTPVFVGGLFPTPVTSELGPEDWWPWLKSLTDQGDAWLYDRGDRTWVLVPRPKTTAEPAHVLQTGPGGTVEAYNAANDQADWANYVRLVHKFKSAGVDTVVIGTAYVSSGPFKAYDQPTSKTLTGINVYAEDRTALISQAGADASARAILARRLRAGQEVTVNAVAAWWVRPGMTVTVNLDGQVSNQLVARVTFDLMRGQMTLTTRTPDTSTIT